ncbi:MAG: FtsX-like permease family protein [Acidimicrobiales bacterium]
MGGIGAWTRAAWRRQRRALLVLGVIAGLGMGVSLVALQGARRADTAYGRLRAATLAPDLLASFADEAAFDRVATLPGVAAATQFSYTPVAPVPLVAGEDAGAFVGLDDAFLFDVYRPYILEGRALRRGATDEVLINEALAARGDLGPGDRVVLKSGFDDAVTLGEVTIVGVGRGIFDAGVNAGRPSVMLPHSFQEAHSDAVEIGPEPGTLLRLEPATDATGFQDDVTAVLGHEVGFKSASDEGEGTNRSLRVQALGYVALAIAVALATLLVVVQGLGRLVRSVLGAELPVLVAIGMRPRQRLALATALAIPVAVVGIALAMVVAIAGSPLVPTGLGRSVDVAHGVQVDGPLLVAGAVAVGLALGLGAVGVAWRLRSTAAAPVTRPTRTSRALRQLPLRMKLGAELALAPRSAPAGAAARSALFGTACAVAVVVAVGMFGASLDRLLDPSHAELAGWDFDVAVSDGEHPDLASFQAALTDATADAPPVAISIAHIVALSVGDTVVQTYAFEPSSPTVHPTLHVGHPPAAGEIVLGPDVARHLGVGLGDRIAVTGSKGSQRLDVVGIATYPEIGNDGDLGNAASVTAATANELGAVELGRGALLRYDQPPDDARLEALSAAGEVVTPFLGPRIIQLEQVRSIPRNLAVFVVVLGVAAIAHGLVRSGRDRRRELAVLRCLGMRGSEVRALLAYQGAVTALVGGTVGLLAGLVVGSWLWERVADSVAAVVSVATPALLLALIVPVAVVLGVVASMWPAYRAGRRSVVASLASDDSRAG